MDGSDVVAAEGTKEREGEKKEATMDESQGRNMEGADGGEVDERSEIND